MKKFIAVVEWKKGVTAADTAAYAAGETEKSKELMDAGVKKKSTTRNSG
jgi:hypothetical protein